MVSVWKPKQAHAQNTLSQPAQSHAPALEQIVPQRILTTNTNQKKTRSPINGLAVCRWQCLTRSGKIKNTKGRAPLDTPKARMRSSLALIIRWKTSCRVPATPVLITPAGRIYHYPVTIFFQYLRGKCPYYTYKLVKYITFARLYRSDSRFERVSIYRRTTPTE